MAHLRNDQIYERCVAAFTAEEEDSLSITITPNAKLRGLISGRSRQIDVLVEDMRFAPKMFRLIVDAKHRKRKLDIDDVEAFEGKMRDVQACHGVLVASSGVTKSATKRAQSSITITILTFEEATEDYDWQFEQCMEGCADDRDYGMVLWSPHRVLGLGPGWLMYRTGKCGSCGSFHLWCADCGSYLSVPDGRIRQCDCDGREWGAIPESEVSGHLGKPESTWLIVHSGDEFVAMDRKPIGQIVRQLDQAAWPGTRKEAKEKPRRAGAPD